MMLTMFAGNLLAQNLYIIEKDDLYGFSDKSGSPVVHPKYGQVKPFTEGLAPVNLNGKWGFIDARGDMKIEPQFWEADNFSNGIAAVHPKGGWGYVDQAGNLIIQPHFLEARRFSEGLAPVRSEKGWFFVDKCGIPVEGLSGYEDAKSFSEGLAAVKISGRWHFITHRGLMPFDLQLANVSSFSDNLAAVQEEATGKYGFVDHSGKYLIRPTYDDAKPFAEGSAAVYLNKRWGYLARNGELQIPNIFPLFAKDFAAGLAVVSDPVDGAEMYINSDGRAQFFKSTKPVEIERGTGEYALVPLQAFSSPPKADVYLIPAYIWDLGRENQSPPSRMKPSELRDYLTSHFELLRGQTNLETRVIEQTYVALFILGEEMQRRNLDVRIGDNSITVSFDHK